ncbi:hypothetical protein CAPTEDRAFT_112998 [Capitella teleta]|uniref:Uncharacterized protein n=1 Tax=Capitella teleta TaxID=283909 RepID=R7UQC8_CAPTE|nr:hypothetical protein CAPTEDRAFT_112998 [Capitella teleta]|eukprot:ELU08734.1 hypothetical protein CAPTEDRAFT_112998 [Capitella teleta]
MDFKDKVVIVTGASSGIGAASAVALAKRGAKVALIGRNEQRLKDNAARCCEEGGAQKVITIIADVTKPDDVRRIVATTLEAFGGIDVLINNAGTSISGDLQSTSMETFDEMIDVNLRSCVAVTKEAQIHIIRSKGVIVNLSSIAGTRPAPHLMAYSVAKAAVEQFTKCLAVEMAPLGVRVNAVR